MADSNIRSDRTSEVNRIQNESEKGINKTIDGIPNELAELKKSALENIKGEDGQPIPEGELTDEQKKQLEEAMKPQVEKLYDDKKNEIKEITDKRVESLKSFEEKLNRDEEQIPKDIEKLEKEIEDIKAQIQAAQEKIANGEEVDISDLEKQLADKNQELAANKEYLEKGIPGLRNKFKSAFAKNQAVIDQGVLGLKKGFSEYSYIDVDNDKFIKGYDDEKGHHEGLLKRQVGEALREQVEIDEEKLENTEKYNELEEELKGLDPVKDKDRIEEIKAQMADLDKKRIKNPKAYETLKANTKKNKELLKYAPEAPNKENIENGDKVEQKEQTTEAPKQNMNITPEMAAQIAKAMAAQKATQGQSTQAVETEDVPVAGDELEDVEPKDFLSMLGYEEGTEINFTNSKDILENFMNNPDISDRVRMKMINDPNCKDVILNCLRTAGKNKKIGKEFNVTRRKILDFAKGPLMAETLKDIGAGEEYYDMGRKEFDNLDLTYREEINNLELQLKKASITPEEKQSIENTINEYEAIRTKINNAREFQRNADYIKTFGTRIQDAKDFVFKKFGLNKKALNPAREETTVKTSVDNKDTKPVDDKQKEDVQKTEPEREEAQPSWKNAVKSEEEKDKAAAQRMENEKEDKAKNEIEKDDMQI